MLSKWLKVILLSVVLIPALMPVQAVKASCISHACTSTPGPPASGGNQGSHTGKKAQLTASALALQNAAAAGQASLTPDPIPTTAHILSSSTPAALQSATPSASVTPAASQTPASTSARALAGQQNGVENIPKSPPPGAMLPWLSGSLLIGFSLSALILAFLGTLLINRGRLRKDGRVVQLDQGEKADFQKQFHDQLIDEIGFPAMDNSAKEEPPPDNGLYEMMPGELKLAGNDQLANKLGKDLTADK